MPKRFPGRVEFETARRAAERARPGETFDEESESPAG
jgi:hypothetical protein